MSTISRFNYWVTLAFFAASAAMAATPVRDLTFTSDVNAGGYSITNLNSSFVLDAGVAIVAGPSAGGVFVTNTPAGGEVLQADSVITASWRNPTNLVAASVPFPRITGDPYANTNLSAALDVLRYPIGSVTVTNGPSLEVSVSIESGSPPNVYTGSYTRASTDISQFVGPLSATVTHVSADLWLLLTSETMYSDTGSAIYPDGLYTSTSGVYRVTSVGHTSEQPVYAYYSASNLLSEISILQSRVANLETNSMTETQVIDVCETIQSLALADALDNYLISSIVDARIATATNAVIQEYHTP